MRALPGALLAAAIAVLAHRAGSLTTSGAVAALIVGTVCAAAGWGWAVLLIAFFVASSLLSRLGEAEKTARTASVVEKGAARDAVQVVANGGAYALAAVGALVTGWSGWAAFGAGALATSTADTWATEIGTLAGGRPRSILSGRHLPVGASGGVTVVGTVASIAGSAFIAGVAALLGWHAAEARAAALAGVAGSVVDSLLGAVVQERRWCDRCVAATERHVHTCGTSTRRIGGVPGFQNDAVNLASALAGGLVAVALMPR
jgi:uncharacterized protein (TIGR00297 family)